MVRADLGLAQVQGHEADYLLGGVPSPSTAASLNAEYSGGLVV